ncbi:MAG: zf-HC2 domain-containing protein [Gemmatimonadota bacterium]
MKIRTPLPCAEVADKLWDYLDGELDPDTTARVWDHLRQCEKCFPRYDFQRAFRGFLRQRTETEVPAELRRKVFRALLREGLDGAEEQPGPIERSLVEGD